MNRRAVTFTPQARSDLLSIGDWIAERAGHEVALGYTARLEAGFERRVAIVFVVSDDEVTILRLHYGGRNWSSS